MITFKVKGNFNNCERFFKKVKTGDYKKLLDKYAKLGVLELQRVTPKDTGLTASSWDYTVEISSNEMKITWTNSNTNRGVPIALLIQYGHAMPNGAYIEGIDYINPALKPVMDGLLQDLRKELDL